MSKHMLKAYINRYEHLIKVFEALPEHEAQEHIKMTNWVETDDCGTARCAAGWAGSDKWFRRQGFRLKKGVGGLYPVYTRRSDGAFFFNWAAIPVFFGPLTSTGGVDNNHPVFGDYSYEMPEDTKVTASDVIAHIRTEIEFLKGRLAISPLV